MRRNYDLARSEAVADEAQVILLKEKGVTAWNEWRRGNPAAWIDLSDADLMEMDLKGIDLRNAELHGTAFGGAKLNGADLTEAILLGTRFQPIGVLSPTRLSSRYRLSSSADLTGANLTRARLSWVNFSEANLVDVQFNHCMMSAALFANVDLSRCHGLKTVEHLGPSTIGIDTIYRSAGNIPEVFLRRAGVPEPFITNMRSLVAAMSPIEFYSCFISYSSKDQEFAERLHADLRGKNVRCWFAPEDLKIGARLRPAFDEAIRVHDKLMVLLSENSVSSPWVEKEVETAFEKERQQKRTVLFPIRLDDAVMETNEAWAADIRRGRHIGDFRDWKNHDSYKKAFERFLRDLKAEG
jgi:uncharacterized protein YjbI with pentapeptide repeats